MPKQNTVASKKAANQTTRPVLVYVGLILIAVVVVFVVIRIGQPQAAAPEGEILGVPEGIEQNLTEDGLPVIGNPDAEVTIIQYEDYGCPNCRDFALVNEPLLIDEYIATGKVRLVSYPVAMINTLSTPGAEAAMCALAQGKYWEYRQVLFSNQGLVAFNRENLVNFARTAGLDVQAFTSCYVNGEYSEVIAQHTQIAVGIGVTGTPTFLINGARYVGNLPFDTGTAGTSSLVNILDPLLENQ